MNIKPSIFLLRVLKCFSILRPKRALFLIAIFAIYPFFTFFKVKPVVDPNKLVLKEYDPDDPHERDDGSLRYLVYKCDGCGGWADRLKGILSAYALALILRREFVIDSKHPCELSKLIEPNIVDWNQPLPNILTPEKVYDLHIYYNFDAILQYENFNFLKLTNKKYLRVNAAIMFADSLGKNKHLHNRIREIGYEPSEFTVFKQIYRWYNELFKLPTRLENQYMEFLNKAKPYKDSKLICAQVRIGDMILHGVKDDFFMNRSDSKLYWNLIKREFIQKLYSNSKNYKIFVTSDKEYVKQEARQVFGDEFSMSTPNSSFHFGIHFQKEDSSQCQSLENVLYDFYIMQHCDAAVISHSGFGILAMMNRPKPNDNLFIYTFADQNELKSNLWNRKGRKFKFYKVTNYLKGIYFV